MCRAASGALLYVGAASGALLCVCVLKPDLIHIKDYVSELIKTIDRFLRIFLMCFFNPDLIHIKHNVFELICSIDRPYEYFI